MDDGMDDVYENMEKAVQSAEMSALNDNDNDDNQAADHDDNQEEEEENQEE